MVNKVQVGAKAPDFTLSDEKNRTRNLKEFLGQKVVLVFFSGSFTTKWTKEVSEFRDFLANLVDLKAQIVLIDINVPSVNSELVAKNNLHFPILSDYTHEVFKAYGLKWETSDFPVAKSAIFILDENGLLRYTWFADNPIDEPRYEKITEILGQKAPEEQPSPFAPTVITISRQTGSGGDEIALKISKTLGYAYFDKTLMTSVGKEIGVSEEEISDFYEDTYKVKSLVDKIFLRDKPAAESVTIIDGVKIRKRLDEEETLSTIQTVVSNLASRGKIIIVGRGGQAILKDKVGILHVRIVAPLAIRIERVMKNQGISKEEAAKCIEDNDKAAAEYLQRFYHINWEDPQLYDIVLNTGKMDLDVATKTIISAGSKAWKSLICPIEK